jgi:CheY-like chemotaxis protein
MKADFRVFAVEDEPLVREVFEAMLADAVEVTTLISGLDDVETRLACSRWTDWARWRSA